MPVSKSVTLPSPFAAWLPLMGIIALGAALRFYGITKEGIWLDEGCTVTQTAVPFSKLGIDWTQGLLYVFLMKLVQIAAGTSEFALRLLPAFLGILEIPLIYLVGKRIFDRRAGMLAALFLAVNPFAIHYSQDARPYTMFMLGALLALWYAVKLAQEARRLDAAGLMLSITFVLYTHPFGVFMLPVVTLGFFMYWARDHSAVRKTALNYLIAACLGSALLLLPQIFRFATLFLRKAHSDSMGGWIPVPDWSALSDTVRHYYMQPELAIVVLLVMAAALILFHTSRTERIAFALCGFMVASCLLLPWAVSRAITPIYVIRYTAPASLAFVLMLGWAVSRFSIRWRAAFISLLFVLSAWPLYGFYTGIDRDPWRETAAYLKKHVRRGDLVISTPDFLRHPLQYYLGQPDSLIMLFPPIQSDASDLTAAARGDIYLVQGYGYEPQQRQLLSRIILVIQKDHVRADEVTINDGLHRNPWAYFLTEVTVARYQPKGKS
jgi:mannosyltransferase